VPFSLTLGLLLPLAFLVQPRPFLAAVVVGWMGALYLFLPGVADPETATPRDALAVVLYTLVLLLAVGAAWLSQLSADAQARGLSERLRAEAQLRSNQAMFVDLIENSPFGIFVVNAAFRMHLAGRGAQRVFEHVRPLRGRDLAEALRIVWEEPFATEAIARFRHTLETGEPFISTETTEQRHDLDAVESYDWRIERITLPDGQWGVLCYFRDISAEVRARQQIAESEARLRLAQSAARLGLHDYDVTTGAIAWDARTRELWGVDADDPITIDLWRDGLHPADREAAVANVARALDPDGDGHFEDQYRVIDRRDGSVRWVESTGRVTFVGGHATRLVGTAQDITSRKQTELELRHRGEQFETVLARAPLGMYLVDADFRMSQVNPVAMQAFEGVPGGVIGRDVQEVHHLIWPPAFAEHVVGIFRHTLETGESYEATEVEEVRADRGVTEYYDWRVDRITLPDGLFGVVTYFRDVSDQVRARLAIAESEQRYRTLFESIDEAFCVLELIVDAAGRPIDFRYLELNPAFEKQTGLRDAAGRRATEVLPHEPHWFEIYGRVARTGEPVRFQNEARAIGRWFDVYAFRVGDPQEQKVAVLFSDITARRQAEESSRFQARLLDEVGQAVVVTDPEGTIIYWNLAAEDLYGWSRAEAIGRHVLETTVGPDFAHRAAGILEQVRSGQTWSGEFEVVSRGDRKTALVTNTGMTDEAGRLTAIVGVSMDITELKQAQQALEDADRRKDEFLATLAHELRNPLAAIRTALDVLARAGDDAARVQGMRVIIDRQSAQLVRLIDDLLDVSRITRGKLELRRQPVALAEVIAHAVDGVDEICQARGLRLRVDVPARSVVIDADPFRFAQVVSNLLSNACKFTDRGGEVVVTGGREGDHAVVRVRDTGVGMAPEDLVRMFEMFAQAPGPAHQRSGLGIGLSLARSIVALHGGTVEAYSDGVGQGSEFVVRVPTVEQDAVAAVTSAPALAVSDTPPAGRVLVVDDNEDVLEAVAIRLRLEGYAVDTASAAAEALHQARINRPSTVLLDIGLPDADGYEVARALRREPWGQDMFLVAVTGWGQQRDKRRARDAGFDVHLTKPVDVDALLRLLGERAASTRQDVL
jgi:PAS domain S-box-containing protein